MKILLISLLLATSFAQNFLDLGSSGDQGATITSNQGDTSQLPSTSPPSQSASSTPGVQALTLIPNPPQPSDWTFLDQNSLGGNSKWIFPGSSIVVNSLRHIVTYTIRFTTECTKKPVILRLSTTGSYFILLNGQLISSWGRPFPNLDRVTINGFKCGCNEIKVLVYNYYFPSPNALIYSLSQDTTGCFTC